MDYSHMIVGGGIYGCFVALKTAELDPQARVILVEREDDILRRASFNNQARVHNGYHYPRSLLTALRSRVNAPRFMAEFSDTVAGDFEQIYAISRRQSNVTAGQFVQFCQRVGAPLRPARRPIAGLFDEDFIEAVFSVTEPVFDAGRLRASLRARLEAARIEVALGREAVRVSASANGRGGLEVTVRDVHTGAEAQMGASRLYNCTYSGLNRLLAQSGLGTLRLTHEATEMALVEVPARLQKMAVTVMCGPFFSLMPFPPRQLATLSHVSYTPHYAWEDDGRPETAHGPVFPLRTRFDRMRRDAARYLPALRDARYVDSIWEVKTILPQSGVNDSRPILVKRDQTLPAVISLLGSKIDNIFDIEDMLVEAARALGASVGAEAASGRSA